MGDLTYVSSRKAVRRPHQFCSGHALRDELAGCRLPAMTAVLSSSTSTSPTASWRSRSSPARSPRSRPAHARDADGGTAPFVVGANPASNAITLVVDTRLSRPPACARNRRRAINVAQTARKTVVSVTSANLQQSRWGLLCAAPSTMAIILSRKLSPASAVMRIISQPVGQHRCTAGHGAAIPSPVVGHRRGFAGNSAPHPQNAIILAVLGICFQPP